ncbi:hypothetical protein AB6A40_007752 [Gnathostoma spinigerum]|uniref:Transmembrane protein 199 n=1 Tax=Gnathostoma spinigerum TaxID=75299 RepID=A0ABD6EVF6_9BILA
MWQVREEGVELLKSWNVEKLSKGEKEKIDGLVKNSPHIIDGNELLDLLKPLASRYPIYKLVENIRPHLQKEESKPSKEYLARITRLKLEQEQREYQQMVKSVDANQKYGRADYMQDFGREMRMLNRHVITIFNTCLTVAGSFAFGFYGIGYAYPSLELNLPVRMLMGLVLGTVVFIADLYFLVKGMDDHDNESLQSARPRVVKFDARSEKMQEVSCPMLRSASLIKDIHEGIVE